MICEVTEGGYRFLPPEHALPNTEGDFRSAHPTTLSWPEPISKDDPRVPPALRHRLGKPGRFSEVSNPALVEDLLERLSSGVGSEAAATPLGRLHSQLRGDLLQIIAGLGASIQAEHPAKDLSSFVDELFRRMRLDPVLQEGPGERGSDVVVEVEHELLPRLRIGAQVFSWQGEAAAGSVRAKLEQLVAGWEANRLDFGLLVTTAKVDTAVRQVVVDHNRASHDRRVRLIDGRELADLFLRHWPAGERPLDQEA